METLYEACPYCSRVHAIDLISVLEAAKLRKVGISTIHRWIERGLPAMHIGEVCVLTRDAIHKFKVPRLGRPIKERKFLRP
jgi:hypothetical protein